MKCKFLICLFSILYTNWVDASCFVSHCPTLRRIAFLGKHTTSCLFGSVLSDVLRIFVIKLTKLCFVKSSVLMLLSAYSRPIISPKHLPPVYAYLAGHFRIPINTELSWQHHWFLCLLPTRRLAFLSTSFDKQSITFERQWSFVDAKKKVEFHKAFLVLLKKVWWRSLALKRVFWFLSHHTFMKRRLSISFILGYERWMDSVLLSPFGESLIVVEHNLHYRRPCKTIHREPNCAAIVCVWVLAAASCDFFVKPPRWIASMCTCLLWSQWNPAVFFMRN